MRFTTVELAALTGLVVIPLFFWCRGILLGRLSDLPIGLLLMLPPAHIISGTARGSYVFGELGFLLIIFGIVTMIVSYFTSPNLPIQKDNIALVGTLAMIIGVLMGLII